MFPRSENLLSWGRREVMNAGTGSGVYVLGHSRVVGEGHYNKGH